MKKNKNNKIPIINPNENKARLLLAAKNSSLAKVTLRETTSSFHAGPLPSPEVLSKYEQLCPGSMDRIILMAEKEQDHSHAQQKTELKYQMRIRYLGAFIVICFMTLTGFAIHCDKSWVVKVLLGTLTIISLISASIAISKQKK